MLCTSSAFALDCSTPAPHPEPNDATGWASWINGCLPQAVPSQTVGLGTFEAAPPPYQGMFWDPVLVPCVVVGPIGGFDRWCKFPRPKVRINSFNVQYEIAVRNKPANYDLEVVLTIPTVQGTRDYPGTVNQAGDSVTIPFHPDTIGTQVLTFSHAGAKLASYEITTMLEPQLGAFVVPYLPVAIVYQPPGSASTARYTIGSSMGTTLCWGTSATSGAIDTEHWSLFFGSKSELVSGLAAASGAVGAIPQAGWVGTVGKVLVALDGLYHTQTDQAEAVTAGQTLCRGVTVSTSVGHETEPGHGDLYLLRKDALFAYVVVLKDPASGNIVPTNGVPTVVLTLVHSQPVAPVYLDDLERDFPPEVVAAFTELNVQMNPDRPIGGGRRPRLKELPGLSPLYCTPDSTSVAAWEAVSFTSSDVSVATTKTTTTQVTGYIASIFGDEGTVTQSITLSSNQANWQAYQQGSQLSLKCPEMHPPYQTWKMDIFLDRVFGTLLAVPGEKSTTTNPAPVAGVVVDARGKPVGAEVVTLKIGGRTFGVLTSADGGFVFRVPDLPRGVGTILVAKEAFRVSYGGSPLRNLRLKLSRRTTPLRAGSPAEGATVASPPATARPRGASGRGCCRITMIDTASRTVTAMDRATRQIFRFKLPAEAALSALEVGQTISADHASNQVLLDGLTGCCDMIPNVIPRFEPLCGGDCVKDRWTGYIWESTPAPTAHSLSQARNRCSSLNSVHRPADLTSDPHARERGWSIPFVWELATLPDPTLPASSVPPNLFFNVQRELYWAVGGTTGGDQKILARVLGTPQGGVSIVPSQSVNLRVWCVLSPWTTGTVVVNP